MERSKYELKQVILIGNKLNFSQVKCVLAMRVIGNCLSLPM